TTSMMAEQAKEIPLFLPVTILGLVVTIAANAALLASGIGVLKRKPSSRALMIGSSIALLIWAVVATVANLVFINPTTSKIVERMMKEQGEQAGVDVTMFMQPWVLNLSAVINAAFVAAYPIAALILANLRSFRLALADTESAADVEQVDGSDAV